MELKDVITLDKEYYMGVFGDRLPVMFSHGEGCTLYDSTGKAYTDFLAGIAVNSLGYNHKAYCEAMCEQVKKVMHYSNYFYNEPQAMLAKKLCDNAQMDKVFFSNSGTEAIEGAMKLARLYYAKKGQKKFTIITAKNSFHGRTLSAMFATGQDKYHQPYLPAAPTFSYTDENSVLHAIPSYVYTPYNDLEAIKAAVTENTCAIMLELIQGEGGVIVSDQSYIDGIVKLCKEKDLLLIIDEVQTGMGRTGKLFCYMHYGIKPDIVTTAKALGNGIPIGAILAKEEIASAFDVSDHGSTFGGNSLACCAGNAVLKEMIDNGLIEKGAKMGEYFKGKLLEFAKKHSDKCIEVRGKGLLLGLSLIDGIAPFSIKQKALEKGYIITTAGTDALRFVPPLIIEEKHIDGLMDCLEEIFNEL